MSEQGRPQASTRQRRSRQTDKQNGLQIPRPANDDKEAWRAYWKSRGQHWRTEQEIDIERQIYLTERCGIIPSIEQGIYPFKDIKLTRADIEWLLTVHEKGRGPVDWNDQTQHRRDGLDLRGAVLYGANLDGLPLARMRGGITDFEEWKNATYEQREMAAVHLEGAHLEETHLEGAYLRNAHLEGARLQDAHLEEAILWAHLEGAYLMAAHLEGAFLWKAHLEGSILWWAHLEGAVLSEAHLEGKSMEVDDLERIRRGSIDFPETLPPTDLYGAFFDTATNLLDIIVGNEKYGFIKVGDVHWGNANLAVVDWTQIKMLGDEREAKQKKYSRDDFYHKAGEAKGKEGQLFEYKVAVRANRQLAVALQSQGLNEDAVRFAYRAQVLQRTVFRFQGIRKFGQYFFSLFLDLLAGYSYKLWRSFLAYLLVITVFAAAYFEIGHTIGPAISPIGSFVFSMTSFHGRGFFPGGIALDDPLTILAAIEAFVGLLIEVTFIATLSQRLFGK